MKNNLPSKQPQRRTLSPVERAAALASIGLSNGWVLVDVPEMFEMRKTMDECQRENERLNGQLSTLIAQGVARQGIIEQLETTRAVIKTVSEQNGPATKDALETEIKALDVLIFALRNGKAKK